VVRSARAHGNDPTRAARLLYGDDGCADQSRAPGTAAPGACSSADARLLQVGARPARKILHGRRRRDHATRRRVLRPSPCGLRGGARSASGRSRASSSACRATGHSGQSLERRPLARRTRGCETPLSHFVTVLAVPSRARLAVTQMSAADLPGCKRILRRGHHGQGPWDRAGDDHFAVGRQRRIRPGSDGGKHPGGGNVRRRRALSQAGGQHLPGSRRRRPGGDFRAAAAVALALDWPGAVRLQIPLGIDGFFLLEVPLLPAGADTTPRIGTLQILDGEGRIIASRGVIGTAR
jgi:hypothetical protein